MVRRAGVGGACPSTLSMDTVSPRTFPGHDDDFRHRFVPVFVYVRVCVERGGGS